MTYILPFKLRPVKIGQGFNQGSHKDWRDNKEDMTYSVDFLLPGKTPIIVARAGTVTKVKISGKENYSGNNQKKGLVAYRKHMNEIEIKHPDETYASYSHLAHNGSFVKKGDKVKKGQEIGLSGNTGWSSATHLDFSVFKKDVDGYKIKTIKFGFQDYKKPLK